jgi:glycerophosphoryl diester phosphodiesterase
MNLGVRCIGHGGASGLAPANTLRSFALAVQLGADVVEFDVRLWRGRIVLAHTVLDACRRDCLELEPVLGWLAGEGLGRRTDLLVDLKTPGIGEPVVEALRRHGLLERSVLASQCPPILREVHGVAPEARTAISVGGRISRLAQRWVQWREEILADLRARRYVAVMAHHRLVDPQLVERVRDTGAELHAWTVRGQAAATALASLGVDGIVTTNPRFVTGA